MEGTRQQLNKIINELEAGGNQKMSANKVMEALLGRKSEYEVPEVEAAPIEAPITIGQPVMAMASAPVAAGCYTNPSIPAMDEQLNALNQPTRWSYNYYRPMPSVGGFVGKFKTFLKKITRKFNRPIVEPLVLDQIEFNGNAVRVMNDMRNCIVNDMGAINQLQGASAGQAQQINQLQGTSAGQAQQINQLQGASAGQAQQIAQLQTNVQNQSAQITQIQNELQNQMQQQLQQMRAEMNQMKADYEAEINRINGELAKIPEEDNVYDVLDYGKFEKYFRGAESDIKNRQKIYLPYVTGKHKVIDLGCGRGEFLELLRENGIAAEGVDMYDRFINVCHLKGLTVWKTDALQYLLELGEGTVDAIVSFQLIEHLSSKNLVTLCKRAYDALIDGGTLILETPNPTCLSIYTNSFYIDMTHERPVHPQTLAYILRNVGFTDVQILYTEGSREGYNLPKLEVENCANLEEFNAGVQKLTDIIWGSQDYAVIATK